MGKQALKDQTTDDNGCNCDKIQNLKDSLLRDGSHGFRSVVHIQQTRVAKCVDKSQCQQQVV